MDHMKCNALSFDLEDYFQVEAFKRIVKYEDWPTYPSRVQANTEKILEILDQAEVQATFFVLGWQAEQTPGLIRKVKEAGHEIASHGYYHEQIHQQSAQRFRECIHKTKRILEDLTGCQVLGYRAPTFSITRETDWSLDLLIEEGYKYDSSIFPIHHDRYGIPDFPRFPQKLKRPSGKEIIEIPPSTIRVFGQNFPIAGGGYVRFLPYSVTGWAVKRINRENQPVFLYFHPWEFDPDQPRMPAGPITTFRHYHNLAENEKKLKRLLQDFRFTNYQKVIEKYNFPQSLSVF